MTKKFDYCILGAGLAGLSLADALAERDISVCVVEKDNIGAGASGTPGGLVNPATGRRATKTWKAEECYKAISENLDKAAPFASTQFFKRNGVLRPAITKKMAGKMRERYMETRWVDGWCEWLPAEEIERRHPGITCIEGGLWLPVAITVDVGGYLEALAAYLEDRGVEIITGCRGSTQQVDDHWRIVLNDYAVVAEHLVHATGYQTLSSEYWNKLPFHPIKGQVARFQVEESMLNFKHSISSLGYIARLSDDNTFIQGSTYEHDFEDVAPSAFGEEYLRGRLRRTLPEVEEQAELVAQWAGVRLSTPNRKPVLGRHPEVENLHLFTGLGSKGLLYGKFLADHYAKHLTERTPLFKEVDIARFEG